MRATFGRARAAAGHDWIVPAWPAPARRAGILHDAQRRREPTAPHGGVRLGGPPRCVRTMRPHATRSRTIGAICSDCCRRRPCGSIRCMAPMSLPSIERLGRPMTAGRRADAVGHARTRCRARRARRRLPARAVHGRGRLRRSALRTPAGAAWRPACSSTPSRRWQCDRPTSSRGSDPCIGAAAFEVGDDVRDAFVAAMTARDVARSCAGAPGKWQADLAALARQRLARAAWPP